MNPSEPDPKPPAAPQPALGRAVSADLEALKNDVEQARELACDYQRQLAGVSNEHATLKQLFEKTKADLIHLHQGINQLREERHQFANEAMKAAALELKLARITAERDCLQNEVQALRRARAGEADERVIQLTRELERLRGGGRSTEPAPERKSAAAERSHASAGIAVPFFDDEMDDNITIVPTEAVRGGRRR